MISVEMTRLGGFLIQGLKYLDVVHFLWVLVPFICQI